MATAWAEAPDMKVLASSTIVVLNEDGKTWSPWRCSWSVQVPSNNPEPDSMADCWKIVDCGAKVKDHPEHPGQGWRCEAGHEHIDYQVWAESGAEARYDWEERQAELRGEYLQDYDIGRDVW